MFRSLAVVALCVLPATAAQDKAMVPKGVWAVPCVIIAVHPAALEVALDPQKFPSPVERPFKLKVTRETQLEQLDVPGPDGKQVLTTRPIKLTDLQPEQPLSVIFFSDGKDLTLLRGVASGPSLSGKDLPIFVDKLGGKVKRHNWKDKVSYTVDLKGTKVTDADLRLLAPMRGLATLDLAFTAVTDKGIAHLAGAEDLSSLDLTGTRVTDAAVPHLRQIPNLHTVQCPLTAITDKGVSQLVQDMSLTVCRASRGDKAHYRVHQNYEKGELKFNYLMIGDTYFGSYLVGKMELPPDFRPQNLRREATTYYHRHGPVGQVLAKLEWFKPAGVVDYPSDVRLPASLVALSAPFYVRQMQLLPTLGTEPAIGVVRLNVGTAAAYGRPGQHIHFYNSTPEIKALTLPPKGQVYFGYIQDARKRGVQVKVIDGPERATLSKKAPKKYYSALFIDLARTDLRDIMTEFMTQEALADLMGTLTETGVVGFHTSHRYQDLRLPIIDAAKALNLAWKVGKDTGDRVQNPNHFGSEWVMVVRKAEYLQHLTNVQEKERSLTWTVPAATGKHLWRDGQPQDLKSLTRPPAK